MKILVDGDSCNVIPTIEKLAKNKKIECHIFFDTNRIIESDYSILHVIDKGVDSVDFAILNNCEYGDIVVTKDGGLAARGLVLGDTAPPELGTLPLPPSLPSFLSLFFLPSSLHGLHIRVDHYWISSLF